MAAVFGYALGGLRRASLRQPRNFIGNLDLAAFPGFSRYPTRYESGGGSAFPAGNQPVGGTRLALLAPDCRRAGMAHVRCRSFNAHNPWWFAMPDLAGYLQRVSFAMRQGKPASDVALLLPNDDAWAGFSIPRQSSEPVTSKGGFNTRGETLSIDESMGKLLGDKVIPQILDAGFNLDFVDGDAIDALGIRYPVTGAARGQSPAGFHLPEDRAVRAAWRHCHCHAQPAFHRAGIGECRERRQRDQGNLTTPVPRSGRSRPFLRR